MSHMRSERLSKSFTEVLSKSVILSVHFADINECDSAPCFHFGTCTDLVDSYVCECLNGTTGIFCETSKCSLFEKNEILLGKCFLNEVDITSKNDLQQEQC